MLSVSAHLQPRRNQPVDEDDFTPDTPKDYSNLCIGYLLS